MARAGQPVLQLQSDGQLRSLRTLLEQVCQQEAQGAPCASEADRRELRNRLEKMTRSVLRHVERSVQVVASSSALALERVQPIDFSLAARVTALDKEVSELKRRCRALRQQVTQRAQEAERATLERQRRVDEEAAAALNVPAQPMTVRRADDAMLTELEATFQDAAGRLAHLVDALPAAKQSAEDALEAAAAELRAPKAGPDAVLAADEEALAATAAAVAAAAAAESGSPNATSRRARATDDGAGAAASGDGVKGGSTPTRSSSRKRSGRGDSPVRSSGKNKRARW